MDKMIKRRIGAEIGEPELGGLCLVFGPLDEEPKFRPGLLTFIVPMRRTDVLSPLVPARQVTSCQSDAGSDRASSLAEIG